MNSSPAVRPSPAASSSATRLLLPGLFACGFLVLLAGCASEPESHLVSAPPPSSRTKTTTTTTVTTTPAPVAVSVTENGTTTRTVAPVVSTVVITEAPPAQQPEAVQAQPSSRHVWLAGYWTWRNERYEWMAGHWELPPSPTATWVAPRWEQQGNAYKFTEGYWN